MYGIMIGLEVVQGSRSENTGEKFCPLGLECAKESLLQTTVAVKELSLVSQSAGRGLKRSTFICASEHFWGVVPCCCVSLGQPGL